MMLLILDKNPVEAANKVPDKLKFKQLLELCQMICSCGYSDIYKKIPQGKAIQEWIKRNPTWVRIYGIRLWLWSSSHIKMKYKTFENLFKILSSLFKYNSNEPITIETAVFRYSKDYISIFLSNTEITAENAIEEYTKYLKWKGYNNV